jgi:flagellar basal body-associated protein FliL
MNTNSSDKKLVIVAIILILILALIAAYYFLIYKKTKVSETPTIPPTSQIPTSIPLEQQQSNITPSPTTSPAELDKEAEQNLQAIDDELKNLSETDFGDNALSDKELGI